MIIKNVKSGQFAGILNREVDFEPGLNILIGENESGKSTLIDLIYHTLFKNASLDGRRDSEFKDKYYPKTSGRYAGDVIDGEVSLVVNDSEYKLSKEWAFKNGRCVLTTPEGRFSDPDTIAKLLKEALVYEQGVFDELVFASQRRDDSFLSALFGGKSDNVEKIAATINAAVMETGGIDIDAIEKSLQTNLEDIGGRWNFETDLPDGGIARGIKNPWKQGSGSIVKAYYAKEEFNDALINAQTVEAAIDRINADLQKKKGESAEKKDELLRFTAIKSLIDTQNANSTLFEKSEKDLLVMESALSDWPEKELQYKTAKSLSVRLQDAELRSRYLKVKSLVEEKDALQAEIDAIGTVDAAQIRRASDLTIEIPTYKAQLGGMNLTAYLKRLGDKEVFVKTVSSGASLPVEDGAVSIQEAVRIVVPDTAEIDLVPGGIDVAQVQASLKNAEMELQAILDGNNVASVEKLKEKQDRKIRLEMDVQKKQVSIDSFLEDDESWETLQAKASALPAGTESSEDVWKEIAEEGFVKPIENVKIELNAKVQGYKELYGSIEQLEADIRKQKEAVAEYQKACENAANIPEEYKNITDSDKYLQTLTNAIETYDSDIESLRDSLEAEEKSLGDSSAEELEEQYQQAVQSFEREKEEYRHWLHIQEVFERTLGAMKGDPMQDVQASLSKYLSLISDGRIKLNTLDNKMRSSISSGNSLLSSQTLSDGTKDTVSLAFRLAVLEHLYPEGGCVAVFDDPFTDMDPRRTANACRLLQEFAKENQVIFVTCDDKYRTLLTGNVIAI